MYHFTQEAIINRCIQSLLASYRKHYSHAPIQSLELLCTLTNLTLRKITESDAPYHDLEHTVLVTLTGQAILEGKLIQTGNVSAEDWLQTILSLLCHDIGYVKGVCRHDQTSDRLFTTATDHGMLYLPPEATDASLTSYHVDRGQCFVEETLSQYPGVDVDRIKHHIELTRFPVPCDRLYQDTISYPGLVRAADLIGQLADPNYLQKTTALFQEFEEIGVHRQLDYHTPEDVRLRYPDFFWTVVYQYIQTGLQYLEVTVTGQQMIHDLHRNLFLAEAERRTKIYPQADGMPPSLSLLKNNRDTRLTSSFA